MCGVEAELNAVSAASRPLTTHSQLSCELPLLVLSQLLLPSSPPLWFIPPPPLSPQQPPPISDPPPSPALLFLFLLLHSLSCYFCFRHSHFVVFIPTLFSPLLLSWLSFVPAFFCPSLSLRWLMLPQEEHYEGNSGGNLIDQKEMHVRKA